MCVSCVVLVSSERVRFVEAERESNEIGYQVWRGVVFEDEDREEKKRSMAKSKKSGGGGRSTRRDSGCASVGILSLTTG